jgi:signal transduction histidine kinase/DNA-binding response OmpR family regulator
MVAEDKANILVVDDLPEKLLSMELILQDLGQNVVTARSGREALRRLLERDFAVILLDVNMPDMDGFETASLVRQRRRSEHTPIIFITAFGDDMHASRGYSLGAVDYVLSPVVPEVLRTKVGVFVDLYQKTEQIKRQAEERVALAREQAARAAAEEATRRSHFLAEAGTVLLRSLDYAATLRALVRQAVPFLGDLAAGTLVDPHTSRWQTELVWVDAVDGPTRQTAVEGQGLHPHLVEVVRRALETGRTEFLPDLLPGGPGAAALNGESGGGGPAFALRTAVVLPLQARGRTLGTLLLAMGPSGRGHGPADRALAEDLAGRAALALDNARLYRDIQDSDRLKNEFLAMLAHELRNPLAPIRNAVQVLQLAAAGPQDQQWAKGVINRQLQQMVRLVDDLLDVSRITRGKIALQVEPVDVAGVVDRAVEISRPLIDARRHALHVSLPPEPIRAQVDPARVAQVVANLLNNAAKYTEEGGSIWLTVERVDHTLVFRVRDTGIGIPPEMLPKVFDLFTQVDRSLDRSQGGLGIGLTLVHRLVEMHGGSVAAFSPGPNRGSEFVVRLPVVVDGPKEQAPAGGPAGTRGTPSLRVLVVDDNVDAAESLALLLRMMGQVVRTVHDGVSALGAAESFQPDVVLLDIGLPRMDGYEVARQLRQRGLTDTLLVAVTGYGQEADLARSREAGFDRHLVKPVDPDTLAELFSSLRRPDGDLFPGRCPGPGYSAPSGLGEPRRGAIG